MSSNGQRDIAVVFANGVLRPERPLGLPENTRLHIDIRRIDVTPEQKASGRAMMEEIRRRGEIRLGGWHPTRDQMHERR